MVVMNPGGEYLCEVCGAEIQKPPVENGIYAIVVCGEDDTFGGKPFLCCRRCYDPHTMRVIWGTPVTFSGPVETQRETVVEKIGFSVRNVGNRFIRVLQ